MIFTICQMISQHQILRSLNIEVVKYACNLINFKLPKIISFDELEEGMLKDFYKDSKKVSNKKIKDRFKLRLIYPTYVEGLKVNI